MSRFRLAQVNVALPRFPMDSPQLAGFVEQLVPVNVLADAAPGFVWRLQTEAGDATSLRIFDDRLIVNMSVWQTVEALADFVFGTLHAEVMRRRREWFEHMTEPYSVAWWIPAETLPTIADAEERLRLLRATGPSSEAFTLKRPFPAPDLPDGGRTGR